MTLRARVLTRFPGATRLTVDSTVVISGSSSATKYGVLFNKNGVLSDSALDTDLTDGITDVGLTISGNAAAIPKIASSLSGGGLPSTLTLATKDEGETIFNMQSFGTNSNSTIVLSKARGTAAAPLALVDTDIIGIISANGWHTAGVLGGAAGTGRIQFVASENWSSTATGTAIHFVTQLNGTAYPTDNVIYGKLNGDGGWTFGIHSPPGTAPPLVGPASFGPGTISQSGTHYINKNTAAFNSGPSTVTFRSAQANSVANVALFDSSASDSAIVMRRSNGTQAVPTALLASDLIGSVSVLGMGATAFSTTTGANIGFYASQNWTDAAQGTQIDLVTTANGTTTHTAALRVEDNGGIRLKPATNPDSRLGAGTLSAPGGLYVNKNTAALNSSNAGTTIHVAQANGTANVAVFDSAAAENSITLRRGNGTQAVPTALQANDLIGHLNVLGMGTTLFATAPGASIGFFAAQNWTDAAQGTYIDLVTSANGGTSHAARVRIENDGGVTVPSTVTGGSKGSSTVNAGGVYVNGLPIERLTVVTRTVNFNSANTDNAISIPLPSGVTNYQIVSLRICNASASISTATWGLFSSTGGGGTAIFAAAQAITVTTASANTNNNMMSVSPATFATQSYSFATLQFRVGTAQGSAATADVIVTIIPL